jgi:hypothetical protein
VRSQQPTSNPPFAFTVLQRITPTNIPFLILSLYIYYTTVYTVAAESTTPLLRRGPPSRGILSLSPTSPPVFILLFQRCLFSFCSDDDSALEVAVFSTYVTAGIYFMSLPHQQAPTTEWHRPAFLFSRPKFEKKEGEINVSVADDINGYTQLGRAMDRLCTRYEVVMKELKDFV